MWPHPNPFSRQISRSRRVHPLPTYLMRSEIHGVMTRAIQGESNTLLLLGGPGSSKSTIVTTALDKLKQEHPDPGSFYTIRLDGQIQTDDKIALREIQRKLPLENNV